MTFAVGTLVGLVWARMTGQSLRGLRSVPAGAWALGVYGLLAFHVCYFFAIQNTPPVEASLVIYLWPLLIVVFSAWLPAHLGGKRLAWFQITGSLLGFAGTALILTGRPATWCGTQRPPGKNYGHACRRCPKKRCLGMSSLNGRRGARPAWHPAPGAAAVPPVRRARGAAIHRRIRGRAIGAARAPC